MPDDAMFDQHLRRAAHAALDAHATTVDVDAEFDALRSRLLGHSTVVPLVRPSPNRFRWLTAAAAALIVVAGVVAIAWPRGGDRTDIVAPPPASDVDVTSAPAPVASAAPGTAEQVTDSSASPTPADPALVELDVGYFGRRILDVPPYFEVDQFSADGSQVGTLTSDEMELLFPRHTLPDGSAVALEGDRDNGRCVNQPLTRESGGTSEPLHPELVAARSIGITSAGVVIAGRRLVPGWNAVGRPRHALGAGRARPRRGGERAGDPAHPRVGPEPDPVRRRPGRDRDGRDAR